MRLRQSYQSIDSKGRPINDASIDSKGRRINGASPSDLASDDELLDGLEYREERTSPPSRKLTLLPNFDAENDDDVGELLSF